MVFRACDKTANHTPRQMLRACGIALLWAMGVASDGYAETLRTGWQAETRLYLTGMINYQKKDNSSVTFDTVATTVELKFSSDTRPYYASLFVDYQFSSDNRFDDNVNLGAYIKYSLQNWDATTYLFVNKSPTASGTWLYAGRLRYRVADNHKLGVEAMGSLRGPSSPTLALGYYVSISDSLSLNVVADPGISTGPDLAGRIELVWQIR